MNQETLAEILAGILSSDEKWQEEVERNILLQNTIEELFGEGLFQSLLENMLLPKYHDTSVPHYRAIELICTFRDMSRQVCMQTMERAVLDHELEELQFELTGELGLSTEIDPMQTESEAVAVVGKIAGLYRGNPKFSARLDKFRLLILPLSCSKGQTTRYQVLVLKNSRPPRGSWAGNGG